jgi:hypothetical protein
MVWALSEYRAIEFFVKSRNPDGNAAPYEWLELFEQSGELTEDLGRNLVGWLFDNYAEKPQFLLWVVTHPQYKDAIQFQLSHRLIYSKEQFKNTKMLALWRLFELGYVACGSNREDIYQDFGFLNDSKSSVGITAIDFVKLKRLLTPKLHIKENSIAKILANYGNEPYDPDSFENLSIEWVFSFDEWATDKLIKHEVKSIIRNLLDWLELTICECLDVFAEIGKTYSLSLDSIKTLGSETYNLKDAVNLLSLLLRDAWIEELTCDSKRAVDIANRWLQSPHTLFQQFALFAATKTDDIDWVTWLLANEAERFWQYELHYEVRCLLLEKGNTLSTTDIGKLEAVILGGNPRDRSENNAFGFDIKKINDREQFALLSELEISGAILGSIAAECLSEIKELYPYWELSEEERYAQPSRVVSYFGGSPSDPHYEIYRLPENAENDADILWDWLKQWNNNTNSFLGHDYFSVWSAFCKSNFEFALYALCRFESLNISMWESFLDYNAASSGKTAKQYFVWSLLKDRLPQQLKSYNTNDLASLARWIELVTRYSGKADHADELHLCKEILDVITEHFDNRDSICADIAESLIYICNSVDTDIKEEKFALVRTIADRLCQNELYFAGKQRFLHYADYLFYLDEQWTIANLVPLLDWEANPDTAAENWSNYMFSNRRNPFLKQIEKSLFETASHYEEIQHSDIYASILGEIAIYYQQEFCLVELRHAIERLPDKGLDRVVWQLWRVLEDDESMSKRENWEKRVLPVLDILPKNAARLTPETSNYYALICVSSGEIFPEALEKLRNYLGKTRGGLFFHKLNEVTLCEQFPIVTLELLSIIFAKDSPDYVDKNKLSGCLNKIVSSGSDLISDERYMRLRELC